MQLLWQASQMPSFVIAVPLESKVFEHDSSQLQLQGLIGWGKRAFGMFSIQDTPTKYKLTLTFLLASSRLAPNPI